MLDSYEALIPQYISKEDFFTYAVEKTIYIPDSKIKEEWSKLKTKLEENKTLYIRGSKASAENQMLFDFYKTVFKNDSIKKDPSNTQNPSKLMDEFSGYKKKDLKNYQLYSPFAKNKNVLLFCAPWNIVYIPKILDPLLSDEAKTPLALEFKEFFLKSCYEKFKVYVDDYNKKITNDYFVRAMDDYFRGMYENTYEDKALVKKFEEVMYKEFSSIKV